MKPPQGARVDLEFIVHRPNMDPLYPPKKQKLRRSAKSHIEVVKEEVEKLKPAKATRSGLLELAS